MPDLSKPPLHTPPREELVTKLKTLTNLRVVRDEEFILGIFETDSVTRPIIGGARCHIEWCPCRRPSL